jgi:ribonucleoside-diphosphate reductase alpha chain
MAHVFRSAFSPSEFVASQVLSRGRIVAHDETPAQMVERIVGSLYEVELRYSPQDMAMRFAQRIGELMDGSKIVFSTPIMTNAGRTEFQRPLSACTVPPVSLRGDLSNIKAMVDIYHQEAMGTGFSFDDVTDPTAMLLYLNSVAVEGAASGDEDRPVGNMGVCSIDHPRIVDFIVAKHLRRDMLWKFNVSVNTPEAFWGAVEENSLWTLRDGMTIFAQELFELIVESAHACADPGIIFMDRLNRDNPVPGMGAYSSVAPCAEVGLLPGETCQFGYINLAAFTTGGSIDLESLSEAVELMTRALDDCLDMSISAYQILESKRVMLRRRKIGVGICGLADLLISMGIPYASDEGRKLAQDVVAFINYRSKVASHNLAKERGSFGAMGLLFGCRYNDRLGFLEQKYGHFDTRWVSSGQWLALGEQIRTTRSLRHCSTIALPPTGRSALVIEASTGVEPIFSLVGPDGNVLPIVRETLGDAYTSAAEAGILGSGSLDGLVAAEVAMLFRTSTQIAPDDHIGMVAALQQVVDESISKTINLPEDATTDDVARVYRSAYTLGLKGMTMYRDGSSRFQPKSL